MALLHLARRPGRGAFLLAVCSLAAIVLVHNISTLLFAICFKGHFPKIADWIGLGLILVAIAFLSKSERNRTAELKARKFAGVVRLQVSADMPEDLQRWLNTYDTDIAFQFHPVPLTTSSDQRRSLLVSQEWLILIATQQDWAGRKDRPPGSREIPTGCASPFPSPTA